MLVPVEVERPKDNRVPINLDSVGKNRRRLLVKNHSQELTVLTSAKNNDFLFHQSD